MIPTDRFQQLLRDLYKRSKADQVRWQRKLSYSPEEEEYRVILDNETVLDVSCESPEAAPDIARAFLMRKTDVVAAWRAEDGGDQEAFEFLRELFLDARRSVSGWDRALETLEKAVKSDHPVGVPF